MPYEDSFFDRLEPYVTTTFKVDNPTAETTRAQQLEFYRRVESLASPLDFDGEAIALIDEFRAQGFAEEDILTFIGILESHDIYKIFGAHVYLDCYEHIGAPEKNRNLTVIRVIGSTATKIVRETDIAKIELKPENNETWPSYEHNIHEVARRTDFTPEERLMAYIFGLDIPSGIDPAQDRLARRRLAEASRENIFTQERWVRAMKVLEAVAFLKDLGLKNTDDLTTE